MAEDETELRTRVRRQLTEMGFVMLECASADEAAPLALADLLELITRTLQQYDIHCQEIRFGREVTAAIKRLGPRVRIINLMLPDMDRMELVKNLARHADTGVIVITGRVLDGDSLSLRRPDDSAEMLSASEAMLLNSFLRSHKRIITRDQLKDGPIRGRS